MSSIRPGRVWIGTSGIVLPGAKACFPEQFRAGSRLHYYGSLFDTLEVNSSFYKVPLPKTFEKWTTEVPPDFKFTVKLWRDITHAKKLLYVAEDIDKFMSAANHLGDKRGCLLVQFPASVTASYLGEVTSILARLAKLNDREAWQVALEARHVSWYADAAREVFERYKVSLVLHDMPGSATPLDILTAKVAYFRFHGPAGDYRGSYPIDFLRQYAERISELRARGVEVFVYFNNTMEGAFDNALSLKKFLV